MVVIVWYLDLQLHVPSVSITIGVVSSNPAHGEVYLMQQYVIKFALDLVVYSINQTYRHDVTEILLKVALNTITLTLLLWADSVYTTRRLTQETLIDRRGDKD
jgi:hypothetical protein